MTKMMSGNCQDLVCYIHIHFHKNLEYVKPLGPYEIFTLGRKRKFYLESSLTLLWTCGTMRKSCFLNFFFPVFLVSTKWDLPSHQIQASEWTWHNHHPCVVKRLVGPGFPSHYTRVQFQSTSETGEVLGTTSSQLWGSFNKQLLHKGKGRRKGGRRPGYLQRVTEEFLFDILPPNGRWPRPDTSDPQPSNRRWPRKGHSFPRSNKNPSNTGWAGQYWWGG